MTELVASMPAMLLTGDCRIQFEAIDPATGAAVANVNISQATIYAKDAGQPGGVDLTLDDPVPLYTPEELAGFV